MKRFQILRVSCVHEIDFVWREFGLFFVTTERFLVDEFAKRSVEREKFFQISECDDRLKMIKIKVKKQKTKIRKTFEVSEGGEVRRGLSLDERENFWVVGAF